MTSDEVKSKQELLAEIARLRQHLGEVEVEASERTRRAQARAREQALAIAATTRDPCVVLDARRNILMVNVAFTRVFGIPSEEAEGQRLGQLRERTWDIPQLRELIAEVVDIDTPVTDFEIIHDFPDLGRQHLMVNARRIAHSDTFAGLILLSIENLTERQRAQARAESHEVDRQFLARSALELASFPLERNIYELIAERLQELVGDAIVLLLAWDPDSAVMVCRSVVGLGNRSRTILELIGRNPIGMQFAILEEQEQSLRRGRLVKCAGGIHEFVQGQISRRACTLIGRLLGLGDIYSLGIARSGEIYAQASILTRGDDLSDPTIIETFAHQAAVALRSRRAERTLKESQGLCNALFDMLSSAVALIDLEGTITKTNRRSAEFFGYPDDAELIGTALLDRVAEADREQVAHLLSGVGATGRTASVECQLLRRGGTVFAGELSSTTILGDDDAVTGIMVIASAM